MELLLLATPTQHTANNPTVELNVKQLIKWSQNLPKDDVDLTITILNKSIKPFNELEIPDPQRLKLLEVYFDTLHSMFCNIEENVWNSLSADQHARIAEDIVWLYLELANGYKIIVRNNQDKNPSSDLVTMAIYRSMELISLGLMHAWTAKTAIPPLAALEFNQLYKFVRGLNKEERKIKAIKSETDNGTISRLFLQFGLLSLGIPYDLTFPELYRLFNLFESFVKYCTLRKDTGETSAYLYVINLMEDALFSSCTEKNCEELEQGEYVLDIQRTVAAMSKWKADQNNFDDAVYLESEVKLLRRYLHSLADSTVAAQPAETDESLADFIHEEEVKLAFGMDTLKFILENNLYIDKQKAIPLSYWGVENKNQKGYLLSGVFPASENQPEIGDVAAIYDSNGSSGDKFPTIGIIRSVQTYEDNKIQLGLEVVTGKPMAINCFAVDPENDCFQEYIGLYFPSNRSINQPATVLADKGLHDQGCTFLVYIKSRAFAIKPRQQLLESPLLSGFSFKVLKE